MGVDKVFNAARYPSNPVALQQFFNPKPHTARTDLLISELRVDGDRLWQSLMSVAHFGATSAGGVYRLALSNEDKKARDWFVQQCRNVGCQVNFDQVGNIFARRPGESAEGPAAMMGSHLDSQPSGGRFDGALGVMAGLEILRTLQDIGLTTRLPIDLVCWTNEEGARFAPAMLGSGVYAGEFSAEYAYTRTDDAGKSFLDSLVRIGYRGAPLPQQKYAAAFELHIEQGPILDSANCEIGVVQGVQGIRWYDVAILGQENHAGPFPMAHRRDAMRYAANLMSRTYKLVETFGPDARVTIGAVDVEPGARNTIPGRVKLTVDLRHPSSSILDSIDVEFRKLVDAECPRETVVDEIWHSPPVVFAPNCVQAVRSATESCGYSSMEMVSGAGHDAVYVSRVAPTSMIFVPCKDGLSHNEAESIMPEHAAAGANVLLQAVLAMAMGA